MAPKALSTLVFMINSSLIYQLYLSKNGEDKDNPERPTEQERDKVLGEAMAIPLQAAEK